MNKIIQTSLGVFIGMIMVFLVVFLGYKVIKQDSFNNQVGQFISDNRVQIETIVQYLNGQREDN